MSNGKAVNPAFPNYKAYFQVCRYQHAFSLFGASLKV